jgi:rhamnose transport system ATP-binding protein
VSLQFEGIQKSFGAITALRGVSFTVAEGDAHALVGENGAGKSTLLKILAGLIKADAGDMRWRGKPFHPSGPREAIEYGIGMVYQEMLCLPNLSVAANIFCGRELTRYGRLDEPAMRVRTRAVLDRLSLRVAPDAPAESLSAAHRQLLQVARALAFDCRILVLDEPTTALTDAEADHLFDVLRDLQRGGTTILYVSHRLPEVFRLCNRITVLRDGAFVGTYTTTDVVTDDIVRAMVGRDLPARAGKRKVDEPKGSSLQQSEGSSLQQSEGSSLQQSDGSSLQQSDACSDEPLGSSVLAIANLSRAPHFRDIDLSVARGEIVGIFGLVGSGRTELLETIFGLHPHDTGVVTIDGQPASFRSPRDAAAAGIVLVPEERQRQGLLFNLNIRHNLVIPRATLGADVMVRNDAECRDSEGMLANWRIKAAGIHALPDTMSGGNQQKVVVAKWMATSPRVLLLDEPTKGVDVGAKFEIHELIRTQAAAGLAVVMVSSDLPEMLALADRIVVMKEGVIQGELAGVEATEEAVMHLATHAPAHRSFSEGGVIA